MPFEERLETSAKQTKSARNEAIIAELMSGEEPRRASGLLGGECCARMNAGCELWLPLPARCSHVSGGDAERCCCCCARLRRKGLSAPAAAGRASDASRCSLCSGGSSNADISDESRP